MIHFLELDDLLETHAFQLATYGAEDEEFVDLVLGVATSQVSKESVAAFLRSHVR